MYFPGSSKHNWDQRNNKWFEKYSHWLWWYYIVPIHAEGNLSFWLAQLHYSVYHYAYPDLQSKTFLTPLIMYCLCTIIIIWGWLCWLYQSLCINWMLLCVLVFYFGQNWRVYYCSVKSLCAIFIMFFFIFTVVIYTLHMFSVCVFLLLTCYSCCMLLNGWYVC